MRYGKENGLLYINGQAEHFVLWSFIKKTVYQ